MIFPETESPHTIFAQRHAPGAATRSGRFWGYGPLIVQRTAAGSGDGGAHHADGSGLGPRRSSFTIWPKAFMSKPSDLASAFSSFTSPCSSAIWSRISTAPWRGGSGLRGLGHASSTAVKRSSVITVSMRSAATRQARGPLQIFGLQARRQRPAEPQLDVDDLVRIRAVKPVTVFTRRVAKLGTRRRRNKVHS